MPRIDFSKLDALLDTTNDFSLTEEQYKQPVGKDLPHNSYYLQHQSALAQFAKSKGLKITISCYFCIIKSTRYCGCSFVAPPTGLEPVTS